MGVPTRILTGVAMALVYASLLMPLTGCKGSGNNSTDTGSAPPTSSTDALASYIKGQYARSMIQGTGAGAASESATGSAAEDMSSGSSPSYSTSNRQESGVDESDTALTDGTYIYVATGSSMVIAKVVPGDSMEVVSTTSVNGTVDSLYLYKKTAVVLYTPQGKNVSGGWDGVGTAMGCPDWIPYNAGTGVALYDVTDPANPALIKDLTTDGSLVSSRVAGSMLRVVVQFVPSLPPLNTSYDGTQGDYDRKVAENLESLKALSLSDLVPTCSVTMPARKAVDEAPLLSLKDFYVPADPCGGSIVGIVSFDLDDPSSDATAKGIVADASVVYSSTESLYITSTWWPWAVVPMSAGSGGTAVAESDAKADATSSSTDDSLKTRIIKFDITGKEAVFAATGEVPGSIISQFSLGEHQGVLHIATSTGYGWGGSQLTNHVYCLTQQGSSLEIAGRIDGIAPGENIYAVRFMGTRGYVVTYVTIDPLFTLDLSDPAHPVVAGELKVPGYSTYLHPLDENHLLTIGKDTKLYNGMAYYQGLSLSIFDIGSLSSPSLVHSITIGVRGTDSEALYDHKAFTFLDSKGLLAFPVRLYENQPADICSYGAHTFDGLYVLRVSVDKGFEIVGRLSTNDPDAQPYFSAWTRGIFLGDSAYAVTASAIETALLSDLGGATYTLPIGN